VDVLKNVLKNVPKNVLKLNTLTIRSPEDAPETGFIALEPVDDDDDNDFDDGRLVVETFLE